jgi:hypothetical protein
MFASLWPEFWLKIQVILFILSKNIDCLPNVHFCGRNKFYNSFHLPSPSLHLIWFSFIHRNSIQVEFLSSKMFETQENGSLRNHNILTYQVHSTILASLPITSFSFKHYVILVSSFRCLVMSRIIAKASSITWSDFLVLRFAPLTSEAHFLSSVSLYSHVLEVNHLRKCLLQRIYALHALAVIVGVRRITSRWSVLYSRCGSA